MKMLIKLVSVVSFGLALYAGDQPYVSGNFLVTPGKNGQIKSMTVIPPQQMKPLPVITNVNTNFGGFRPVKLPGMPLGK